VGILKRLAGSPPALLACLIAGGLLGHFLPETGLRAALFGKLYLAVVSMAALPLLVVATFFGLRQTLTLPQPIARVLMIAGIAVLLMALAAFGGTLTGVLAEPGGGLDPHTRAYLGELVQQAGSGAGDVAITLAPSPDDDPKDTASFADLVPDNFFHALTEGQSLGILLCALLFGLAFAALGRSRNSALNGVLEAVYRALEIIISQVNLFIPVVVFSMAAWFVSRTDAATLAAMGSFVGWFALVALGGALAGAAVIARQCGSGTWQVLQALQDPAIIAFTSGSNTASIPSTIDAMSNRLGFSRGIVELVTPLASVFMRAGPALYYALVTVFVANIYGHALAPQELALVALGSCVAAFASSGHTGAANVAYAGMVLSLMQLPAEAAMALFLAIDLLCDGPRSLLTLVCGCVLMALVSHGLPSERQAAAAEGGPARQLPVRFVFTRGDLLLGAACSLLVAALLVVLGIGVGMKRGSEPNPLAGSAKVAVEKPL
jgi:Na+/H+-dicarboxylate symporter